MVLVLRYIMQGSRLACVPLISSGYRAADVSHTQCRTAAVGGQ